MTVATPNARRTSNRSLTARRLCLPLVCALALAAGCGGGGSSTKESVAKAELARVRHDAAMAYTNCQKAAANPGLSSAEKTILLSECADIKTGDSTALKAAGRQLCLLEAKDQPKADQAAVRAGCPKG